MVKGWRYRRYKDDKAMRCKAQRDKISREQECDTFTTETQRRTEVVRRVLKEGKWRKRSINRQPWFLSGRGCQRGKGLPGEVSGKTGQRSRGWNIHKSTQGLVENGRNSNDTLKDKPSAERVNNARTPSSTFMHHLWINYLRY